MFASIAPFGALAAVLMHRAQEEALDVDARDIVLACVVGLACLTVVTLLADTILDAIDVSGPSFQFAAGAALTPLAMRLIFAGDSTYLPERMPKLAWLVPLGVPLIAGPVAIIAAISYAARFGEGDTIGASAIAVSFTGALLLAAPLLQRFPLIYATTVARLSGALILVLAVELAYDGVRSV